MCMRKLANSTFQTAEKPDVTTDIKVPIGGRQHEVAAAVDARRVAMSLLLVFYVHVSNTYGRLIERERYVASP